MSSREESQRLNVLAVALVVVTLIGSVLIPARLTWRAIAELEAVDAVDPAVAFAIHQTRTLERTSLVVNGVLVLVALAAVMAVVALTRRQRRLLREAREGRRQLERAMKGRSRLMRGFSHDVKNPLGAADGFAELLEMGLHGGLTPDQHDTIQHIRRCIKTALGLINDLHQLGRAETGHVVLNRTEVDLGGLLRTIAEDYQGAATAKDLALSVEVPRDNVLLETDGARVREIVANLMSNAIKYTARGSVILRLHAEPALPSGREHVRIDVVDTGPGIPSDKQDLIFEEFSRLGNEEGGAGVGLAISKLLADALGGRVSVVSRPGEGSTFSLWLPKVPPLTGTRVTIAGVSDPLVRYPGRSSLLGPSTQSARSAFHLMRQGA